MKKIIITLIILAAIAGVLIATCPDAQKHRDVVNTRVEQAVTNYMNDKNDAGDSWAGILSSTIGSLVGKLNIASGLKVHDCALFSYGTVDTSEKKNQLVTLGILNHVFCFISEDDVKDFIGESVEKSGLF